MDHDQDPMEEILAAARKAAGDDPIGYIPNDLAVVGAHLSMALLAALSNRIGFDFANEVKVLLVDQCERFEVGSDDDKADSKIIRRFIEGDVWSGLVAGAPPPAR